MQKCVILYFLLFLLCGYVAAADVSLSGYYKNFSVALNMPDISGPVPSVFKQDMIGLVNNRVRLEARWGTGSTLLEAAYDISPRIQDPLLFDQTAFIVPYSPFTYRIDDVPNRLYPRNKNNARSFGIFQNLDRAFLKLRFNFADVYIGRQAIAWGSARVINPTDIIAPYTFEELDTEDRVGVDAIRMRIPIGFMGELDAGYVAGPDFTFANSAVFLRGKYYLSGTDVSAIVMSFQEHALFGLNLARSIGGAGVWFEGAWVEDYFFADTQTPKAESYLRGTIGTDYNFSSTFYGFVEYHFNGAGKSDPDHYLNVFQNPAAAQGSVYLMGKHYLIPGCRYQLSPLIHLVVQTLWNLEDQSFFLTPQLEYNIAENIYLSAGTFQSIGASPHVKIGPGLQPQILADSEFGIYPDIYFTSFRIYF